MLVRPGRGLEVAVEVGREAYRSLELTAVGWGEGVDPTPDSPWSGKEGNTAFLAPPPSFCNCLWE